MFENALKLLSYLRRDGTVSHFEAWEALVNLLVEINKKINPKAQLPGFSGAPLPVALTESQLVTWLEQASSKSQVVGDDEPKDMAWLPILLALMELAPKLLDLLRRR